MFSFQQDKAQEKFKRIFCRRCTTSTVDKEHAKPRPYNLKSSESDTSRSFLSQDFTVVVPSYSSSSSLEFTVCSTSLDARTGEAAVANDQKSRTTCTVFLPQEFPERSSNDESNAIIICRNKNVWQENSKKRALRIVTTKLTELGNQIRQVKYLIDQRNHKIALCFQNEKKTKCGCNQAIMEMKQLLQLESHRDCLLKIECELEKLQRMIQEDACGKEEMARSFQNMMTQLSSSSDPREGTTANANKSSDELCEEAQTRVEACKLLQVKKYTELPKTS